MSDRMSDEEFGVLYHVELPKWQEELGDPNLDKFADEARRARDEVKAWKAAHKKMEKKLIYVGALAHTGKEPPDVFDSPQADYVRKLRARVAELAESRAEIVDQRNKYFARVAELEEWIKGQLCTACEAGAFADGLFEEGRKP